MKICIKGAGCVVGNINQPLSEFYKQNGNLDGRAGRCKLCCKADAKKRHDELIKNPDFVESEKKRAREKYHRLYSDGRHYPSPEKKREVMKRYNEKYPEKLLAKNKAVYLKPKIKGNQLHHWSYNEEHYKDVIELSNSEHAKIHRYMKYSQPDKMYRTLSGLLLNTRELHERYISIIADIF